MVVVRVVSVDGFCRKYVFCFLSKFDFDLVRGWGGAFSTDDLFSI